MSPSAAGAGGSGIVIVRYKVPTATCAVTYSGNESKGGSVPVDANAYNVFWSSNLLDVAGGFQLLYSNLPWNVSAVTDTVHAAENQGYYRINVKFE